MDRFEEIKEFEPREEAPSAITISTADFIWLIAEIERLRKIEDAAIAGNRTRWVSSGVSGVKAALHLDQVLRDNPRPGD
ncbi:MAG: hypothetical protein ACR2QF_10200 [Geminicoccaceae bacterium]